MRSSARPDSTARLRRLSGRLGTVGPAAGLPEPPAVDDLWDDHPGSGWVPDFSEPGDGDPAGGRNRRRARRSAEPDPGREWAWDSEPDTEPTVPAGPDRFRLVRHGWGSWAQRWVPEPVLNSRRRLSGRSSAVLVAIAVIAIAVAGWGWWQGRPTATPVAAAVLSTTTPDPTVAAGSSSAAPTESSATSPPSALWVSVTGRVQRPGLYEVAAGSRVADALDAAGGLLDQADLTGINLAQPLTDGDSVVVGQGATTVAGPVPAAAAVETDSGPALLDLNTADQAALEGLPGVGPVMAGAILGWRTDNGPFTSVEQLREISGIGPARFAQLAPLVRV